MNEWKQFHQVAEIPVTWSVLWLLFKKWLRNEPYHLTISFTYKETGSVSLAGAQVEFGRSV